MEVLHKVGEPYLVGSVPLKTIVKQDIDIHIKSNVDTPQALETLKDLFPDIMFTTYPEKQSVKAGFRHRGWDIEIWVSNRFPEAVKIDQYLKRKMTKEKRETVLKIKNYFHRRGKLRNSLSLAIYVAVICHEVKDVSHFQKFVKEQGGIQQVIEEFKKKTVFACENR